MCNGILSMSKTRNGRDTTLNAPKTIRKGQSRLPEKQASEKSYIPRLGVRLSVSGDCPWQGTMIIEFCVLRRNP